MSAAQPLTLTQRLDRYRRQTGRKHPDPVTARQNRRVKHKLNRAWGRSGGAK